MTNLYDALIGIQENTVQEADLSDMEIKAGDMSNVLNALAKNRTLTRLYMANIGLDDQGVKAIAATMKSHPALAELYLSRNPGIGDTGGEYLLEAIKINRRIVKCQLGKKGGISKEVLERVSAALQFNQDNPLSHSEELQNTEVMDTRTGEGVTGTPDQMYKKRGERSDAYYQNLLREQQALLEKMKKENTGK
eukprot:TRINITY_DN62_c0_g1_i1.p1 TRINITY_DN62_c0_g1~~TRINITY_DN62_c0_g1_i1.p1  ORF type:complete len:210 (+),score=31.99 TRINITY_DN62_c0_g1_i1:54-632(+)